MNLLKLQPSRKRLKEGDIFVMLPPDKKYLFGRIMSLDAKIGFFSNVILIYVYKARSESKKEIPYGNLIPANLLIPPMGINRLPWSKGYCEVVENQRIKDNEKLPRNVFWSVAREKYFDDKQNEVLDPPTDIPIGVYGLSSYRVLDDEISKALGISLAPD